MPPTISSPTTVTVIPSSGDRRGRRKFFSRWAQVFGAVAASLACTAAIAPSARAEECPNAAFRTGPSAHLPDCRAYELVTPPYKNAGYMFRVSSDPEGTAGVYADTSALPGAEGFQNIIEITASYYLTERTSSGWVSIPEDLPSSEFQENTYAFTSNSGISLDGRTMLWQARRIGQAENRIDLFMRRPDRSIVDLGPMLPPTAPMGLPFNIGQPIVSAGVSADASHAFFTLSSDYWPFDGTQSVPGALVRSLYEYAGVENSAPMLVGVDNAGKQISECGEGLGADREFPGAARNAVSPNGDIVFFTAQPKGPCTGIAPPVAELFARIDNGQPDAHTVAISEPSQEDCAACDTESSELAEAIFQSGSEDGSKVVFATSQPLLGGDPSMNLYEYDFDAPAGQRLVRISGGDSTVSSTAAEVQSTNTGIYAEVSEDASHVYFVARGVLTRTPNEQGEVAEVGANNFYVYQRDSSYPDGHIAFIAKTVPNQENITPDGRFLVFTSSDDLTPDDTSTARQVFEYDSQTGTLVRVSIGQDGYNDDGNTPGGNELNAALANLTYGGEENAPSSYWSGLSVSADGSYVFFKSPVGLTTDALDRKLISPHGESVYAQNVYEYHDGRVSLISDGQDITDYNGSSVISLDGTDASGHDVFFVTADRLVGQDVDTNVDVYDARINGGFSAPAPPASCSGDSCQGALSAAPTLLSPGSEFQAGGNPPLTGPTTAAPTEKAKSKAVKKKTSQKKKVKKRRKRGGKAKKAGVEVRAMGKAGRS